MKYSYQFKDTVTELQVEKTAGGFRAQLAGKTFDVRVLYSSNDVMSIMIDGKPHTVNFAFDGTKRFVATKGRTFELKVLDRMSPRLAHVHTESAGAEIRSPMPGIIRAIQVRPKDSVEAGQTLMTLEAMKMEIRIQALQRGTVKVIVPDVGDTVERDQLLIEIE